MEKITKPQKEKRIKRWIVVNSKQIFFYSKKDAKNYTEEREEVISLPL